jgi:hypothetical protein
MDGMSKRKEKFLLYDDIILGKKFFGISFISSKGKILHVLYMLLFHKYKPLSSPKCPNPLANPHCLGKSQIASGHSFYSQMDKEYF